jgi:hypothetical protein
MVGQNVYIAPSTGARACRICKADNQSKYNKIHGKRNRERHADKIAENMKNWRERNREHEAEYRKAYRPRALELRRAKYSEEYKSPRSQAYREKNREKIKQSQRELRVRNKQLIAARRVSRNYQIKQAIGTPRRGRYTAAEDVIVLRLDLSQLEKAFMLQRTPTSVNQRKCYLSDTTKARIKRQREHIAEYQRNYRESNRDRLEAARRYRMQAGRSKCLSPQPTKEGTSSETTQ